MQLMATTGTEGGECQGLGWIPGKVVRLEPTETDRRIPHVGWNSLDIRDDHPLLTGIAQGSDVYFVHSYHMVCDNDGDVVATTPYCGATTAIMGKDHMMGVQFHPEKSHKIGLKLLRNFLAM